MEVILTKEEKELLVHAADTCGCESYFGYVCGKCRAIAEGFVIKRKAACAELETRGYIKHTAYHGWVLTRSGAALAAKSLGVFVTFHLKD